MGEPHPVILLSTLNYTNKYNTANSIHSLHATYSNTLNSTATFEAPPSPILHFLRQPALAKPGSSLAGLLAKYFPLFDKSPTVCMYVCTPQRRRAQYSNDRRSGTVGTRISERSRPDPKEGGRNRDLLDANLVYGVSSFPVYRSKTRGGVKVEPLMQAGVKIMP